MLDVQLLSAPGQVAAVATLVNKMVMARNQIPWVAVNAIGVLGFFLVGVQWLMDDLLTLRCTGCLASTSFIVFNYFAVSPPLMLPICANMVFIAINLTQIGRVVYARRGVVLDTREQVLWDAAFGDFLEEPQQLRDLLAGGNVVTVETGQPVAHDKGALHALVQGAVAVHFSGARRAVLKTPGDFIGELGLLLRQLGADHGTSAGRERPGHEEVRKRHNVTVLALKPSVFYRWDRAHLAAVISRDRRLLAAVNAVLARQLAMRLQVQLTEPHLV